MRIRDDTKTKNGLSVLALVTVMAVHLAILATLPPEVFWSPDEGGKFLQMYARLTDPAAAHRLVYVAAVQDPFYVYYPDASLYPQPLWPCGVRSHWPPWFPLAALPFFRILGLWGLYVLPLFCGWLTLLLASTLARRIEPAAPPLTIFMAGLATPLLFHSVLFFEHTLAAALGLALLLCVLRVHAGNGARRWNVAGGLLCLVGLLALRDEGLLWAAACLAGGGAVLAPVRVRNAVGATVVLLVLMWVFWPMGEEPTRPVATTRLMELLQSVDAALHALRSPEAWRALPTHVLAVAINNPAQHGLPLADSWTWCAFSGGLLCLLSRGANRRLQWAAFSTGALALGLAATVALAEPSRYRAVHGIFLVAPVLALAWLPGRAGNAKPVEPLLRLCLATYVGLFLLATWCVRRSTGGPEWGARYALLVYPLASAIGSAAVMRCWRTAGRGRRLLAGALAGFLFLVSCGFSVRGIYEVQVSKRDLQAFDRELAHAPGPVVTDLWWLAAALAPRFVDTEFYTLAPDADFASWLARLGGGARGCLHVSYQAPPDLPPVKGHPRMVLRQRRVIQNMVFSQYAVEAGL